MEQPALSAKVLEQAGRLKRGKKIVNAGKVFARAAPPSVGAEDVHNCPIMYIMSF